MFQHDSRKTTRIQLSQLVINQMKHVLYLLDGCTNKKNNKYNLSYINIVKFYFKLTK